MPSRGPDSPSWRWSAFRLGWARHESGVLIGNGAQRPWGSIVVRPPGSRAGGLAADPGSFYLAVDPLHTSERLFVSAPAARPPQTGALDGISGSWSKAAAFILTKVSGAREPFEFLAGRSSWLAPAGWGCPIDSEKVFSWIKLQAANTKLRRNNLFDAARAFSLNNAIAILFPIDRAGLKGVRPISSDA